MNEYLADSRLSRLLPRFQSAYRRTHSTNTALLEVFSDVVNAVDLSQLVILLLLDMSTAFDTVDPSILIKRLSLSFGTRTERSVVP